jgi:secreted trypsin-like serine protease
MKAKVEEIPLTECVDDFKLLFQSMFQRKFPEGITDVRICAKNRQNKQNTCQGDSGSGLFVNEGIKSIVLGITSYGQSCTSPLPSFYTRVSKYLDWIEEIVWL